jgi:large subunit ribosomal protein L24
MQSKLHVKKGDLVKVIAGDKKGEEGKILSIDKAKSRAFVEGVKLVSKHTKPNAKSPQGGIVKQEASIHISNLKLIEAGTAAGKTTTRVSKKKSKEVTK